MQTARVAAIVNAVDALSEFSQQIIASDASTSSSLSMTLFAAFSRVPVVQQYCVVFEAVLL